MKFSLNMQKKKKKKKIWGFGKKWSLELTITDTSDSPFKLEHFVLCIKLFIKKNDKSYILDVHCSVRIRIFDEMTLNQKPLFKFFLGEAFAPIPMSAVPIARHTALAVTLVSYWTFQYALDFNTCQSNDLNTWIF